MSRKYRINFTSRTMFKIKEWLFHKQNVQFEIIQRESGEIQVARRIADQRIFERGKGYELEAAAGYSSRRLYFHHFYEDLIHVDYNIINIPISASDGKIYKTKINEITYHFESYPSPIPEEEWLWEEQDSIS